MYSGNIDTGSLVSLDSSFSIDSADSRVCLLNERPRMSLDNGGSEDTDLAQCASQTTCQLSETDKACRKADLEGILLHQVRTQDTALASQRVVLTNSMKRGINVAPVITAVNRMGALRYANQDSATKVDRRATDMEGFFKRLDRLSVNKLNEGQRYSPAQALK